MHINKEVIKDVSEMLNGHLERNITDIDQAFIRFDEDLSLSLSVKFQVKNDKLKVDTSIGFVTDKVKDNDSREIDPEQKQLFD